MRTCVGCRRKAPAEALVRVVRASSGVLELGPGRPGRGAWLCATEPCIDTAIRRRALCRALKAEIDLKEMEALRTKLGDRARIDKRLSGIPEKGIDN